MGVNTYTLNGSGIELREGTKNAAGLAVINAAASTGFGGLELGEASAFFGLDADNDFPSLGLSNERLPWFNNDEAAPLQGGTGPFIFAQAIAPFVVPGCWHIYESDGEPWALVFDGQTVRECGIIPHCDALSLILDGGERVLMHSFPEGEPPALVHAAVRLLVDFGNGANLTEAANGLREALGAHVGCPEADHYCAAFSDEQRAERAAAKPEGPAHD